MEIVIIPGENTDDGDCFVSNNNMIIMVQRQTDTNFLIQNTYMSNGVSNSIMDG